ncbi:hypothetical protein K474DRAFT_1567003, partial [Panus rudis PR-1116 ss-1]
MITLSPGSLCDVCAEEYGPHNYPHCIPCGHVLCLSCCNHIIQKSAPKLTPSCPFCREHFTSDTVRLIRIDFSPSSSGWSTPRHVSTAAAHGIVDDTGDDDDMLSASLNKRAEAKRLEHKVARVAAKKCSVEEVTALHKELQDFLAKDSRSQVSLTTSLYLSSALLRAILMNHLAHSEATKAARNVELNLKDQLDEVETAKTKLDSEMRRYRSQYSQLAQECSSLRTELARFKVSLHLSPPRPSTTMPSVSPTSTPLPRSRATSPISPTQFSSTLHSPMASRLSSTTASASSHHRSASVAPTVGYRSATPSVRSKTPGIGLLRSESTRPSTPQKSRTLSMSSPISPKIINRSSSNESSDE